MKEESIYIYMLKIFKKSLINLIFLKLGLKNIYIKKKKKYQIDNQKIQFKSIAYNDKEKLNNSITFNYMNRFKKFMFLAKVLNTSLMQYTMKL